MVHKRFFLTSGSGRDNDSLISFGLALEDAGIAKFNLVPVSSILPPGCELVSKEEGLKALAPGQIVYCVLARNCTQEDKLIAAGIGTAFPKEQTEVGCLFEYTSVGQRKSATGREAEKRARALLRKSLKIKPAYSLSIAKEARGREGIWTTVVAVAVFV